MINYDLVIPVSYKDSSFLNKTLPYIHNQIGLESKIYILTSKKCFSDFSTKILAKYNAVLLDENNLLPELSYSTIRSLLSKHNKANMTGWYFQQFLKIAFALTQYARDYYLIWDADTIPLRPITFSNDEHLLVNPKRECHTPYFVTIEKILGYTKTADYSFISEHMIVKTSIMKEMIRDISNNKHWWEAIIENCDFSNLQAFSEFETYGTYCMNKYPGLYTTRQLMTLRCGGKIFGRQVSPTEIHLLSLDFDTASFERGQYPPFPRSITAKLDRLWIEFKHKIQK